MKLWRRLEMVRMRAWRPRSDNVFRCWCVLKQSLELWPEHKQQQDVS